MSKCANCGRQFLDHRAKDHACPIGAKTRAGYIHYRPDMFFSEKKTENQGKTGKNKPKSGKKKPKRPLINVHYTDGKRVAVCSPYGTAEWENTTNISEVTCRSCIRVLSKRKK